MLTQTSMEKEKRPLWMLQRI